ncbi:hypothetical protein [Methylogaea oryzae]|uniref:Uncharacterized protein n=2 Tax=Methylogaea oryzae TaxID=1295382 RepID=A0A8D5AGY7_9GAMM|nr:hypothetical protein [Methylogaea oryzae]BBL69701.1 hypothetical protein MoryE10_03070 [Methylogaea oryzae]
MAILGNPGFAKNYVAAAVIAAFRIVKFGANDGEVQQSAASADLSIGVCGSLGAAAIGDRVDIIREGLVPVEFGGTVTRGQALTSDANGKAVAATPAAIKQTVVDGAAAGNVTVTGIATTDTLVAVIRLDVEADTGTSASGDKIQAAADLTAEFTITAANTINNAAGTNTTGDRLMVTYRKALTRVIGYAEVSAVAGDIGLAMIEPGSI